MIDSDLRKLLKSLSEIKFALDRATIVGITDAKGVITYVNDECYEIFKYLREELIGKTHELVNSGYHCKIFFQNLWSTICQRKVWQGEIKNKVETEELLIHLRSPRCEYGQGYFFSKALNSEAVTALMGATY